eukprot:gnl/MRDRNA2_/MRDRNA2_80505_c0_seq1.p1 gnl/MRDRNA2_/MRDRNA2_80505_c0~~gnl/MRDRNA2_/MRDRNA2_80505_c0_seq1.p1  ORF type:complete len:171 (+),score=33.27 gnl/MRDRNA2_/MRDRNA2_80505_c0_seq1:97-609(+)
MAQPVVQTMPAQALNGAFTSGRPADARATYAAQIIKRTDGVYGTWYKIQVTTPSGDEHFVSHQYETFRDIYQRMRPRFPGMLPSMPHKSVFRKALIPGWAPEIDEDLNILLQGLLDCDPQLNDSDLRLFFHPLPCNPQSPIASRRPDQFASNALMVPMGIAAVGVIGAYS